MDPTEYNPQIVMIGSQRLGGDDPYSCPSRPGAV